MVRLATYLVLLMSFSFCQSKAVQTMEQKRAKKRVDAFEFVKKNKMNTNYALLVDMSIHSGKKRMFLVDFKKDSIIEKAICSHGSCDGLASSEGGEEKTKFSNVPNSYCTSLGRYRIGKRSYSNWGINVHYKLHGLDSTNSNAFKRVVVLHSYDLMPNSSTYPLPAPTSLGCPMVSNKMMRKLDELMKKEERMLLWIYE